jgi:hypothetical protein
VLVCKSAQAHERRSGLIGNPGGQIENRRVEQIGHGRRHFRNEGIGPRGARAARTASWREPEAADPVGGSSGGALWRLTPRVRAGQILRVSRGFGRRGGRRSARRGWAGQGSPAPRPPHGSIHGDTTPHSGSAPRLRSPETDTAIPAAAQRSARSGRGSGPSLVPPESGMHHHPCRRTVPPAAPAW